MSIIQAVTSWVAMHPRTAGDADKLIQLVRQLHAVLSPYGNDSVWTNEPRTYGMVGPGFNALASALRRGAISQIVLSTAAPGVSAMVDVGSQYVPRVGYTIRNPDPQGVNYADAVAGAVDFVQNWFLQTDAAMGFVSLSGADSHLQTGHEAQLGQGGLVTWEGVRKFLRGVFWGMALGVDLCDRFGGSDVVRSSAPVPIANRLGAGVWLQASMVPDPDPSLLEPLRAYVTGLLSWTRTEIGARPAPPPERQLTTPTRRQVPHDRSGFARIPVVVLPDAGSDTGLNVYFKETPTPALRSAIEATVNDWYAEGILGDFGGGRLHELTGPTFEHYVMRWRVDFGTADPLVAAGHLAEVLGRRSESSSIERILLGTERVP